MHQGTINTQLCLTHTNDAGGIYHACAIGKDDREFIRLSERSSRTVHKVLTKQFSPVWPSGQ